MIAWVNQYMNTSSISFNTSFRPHSKNYKRGTSFPEILQNFTPQKLAPIVSYKSQSSIFNTSCIENETRATTSTYLGKANGLQIL